MAKLLFGFIDARPKIILHYIPLTLAIFLAHYLSTNSFFDLEVLTTTSPMLGWTLLFLWYYAFGFLEDNLFHAIFGD